MKGNEISLSHFIPECTISAEDMSDAISIVATKLTEWGIILSEGSAVLYREAQRLRNNPRATSWGVQIDREEPVVFAEAEDKAGKPVFPRLVCEGIKVVQEQHERPPFAALDIAVEVFDSARTPVARWHIDLANSKNGEFQHGPLTHLQYGGHVHGHRELDHPLKVPRWIHPPMEIVLLCEVIAANFYPEYWAELREDQNWCHAIGIGQKLCYSSYLRKMASTLSVSSRTLLHASWASEWV